MAYESPHLYSDLATWFHLLTPPAGYQEEAAVFTQTIRKYRPGARSVLELGSGGGNNASHMKKVFDLTLTDYSAEMLAVSKWINPELPHIQGDMRSLRLNQTFDAVFVHDAVEYLTTEEELRQMMRTAAAHLEPGGMVLIVPDFVKETFRPGTDVDGEEDTSALPPQYNGRSLRSLQWTYDPDPDDTTYIVDFAYLLREDPDRVRCVYDRHINGLFPRATWLGLLEEEGFQAFDEPYHHSEIPWVADMFVGIKQPAG